MTKPPTGCLRPLWPPLVVTKIGVLDSGLGGLSVLRQIHHLLPNHPTIYYADQAHVPYGPRPAEQIMSFVENISQFLIEHGARVIVIACHAASAASLYPLRVRHPETAFVGIEPAVKPAAETTRSGIIGVLTTQATADGALYRGVVERFAHDKTIITRVAPELVELVEAGSQHTAHGREIIRQHVAPLINAGVDHIVLACTHFAFLQDEIAACAGSDVTLVDPGLPVARQTARLVTWEAETHTPEHLYFTSGSPASFDQMAAVLMDVEVRAHHIRPETA